MSDRTTPTSRRRLAWILAGRFLASRKRGKLLSFITWIALGGVTVGVTALVVVIGVMTGMQNELREKILGSQPHVRVRQAGMSLRLEDWKRVVEVVEDVDGVVAASAIGFTRVGLQASDFVDVLDLYGVDLEGEGAPLTPMEDSLRTGRIALPDAAGGATPVALGIGMASRMNVLDGDTLTVIALENWDWSPNGDPVFRIEDWVVSGIFETGMYDFDLRQGYAGLDDVQRLLRLDETVASFVGARVEDPWAADEMTDRVEEALGGWPYIVDSWTTDNRQLFSALKLEKLAMALILSLIVLVAALNIVGTLIMVVVNRTKEIGILKAMGLTRKDTLRAFMFQGLWIGVVGTFAGLGLGLTLAVLIERYKLIPIPPDVYFVDRLPVELSAGDILWIAGVSLLISVLATIYPARQAAALEPIEAIRHE